MAKYCEQPIDLFFRHMMDDELPTHLQTTIQTYRTLACAWNVPTSHPVTYRVRAGYELPVGAYIPMGTYREVHSLAPDMWHEPTDDPRLSASRDFSFTNLPTRDCIVFMVPHIVPGSVGWKSVDEHLEVLKGLREKLDLAETHMILGRASLVAGLVYRHHQITGRHMMQSGHYDTEWLRTSTEFSTGGSIGIGHYWLGNPAVPDIACRIQGNMIRGPKFFDEPRGLGVFPLGIIERWHKNFF